MNKKLIMFLVLGLSIILIGGTMYFISDFNDSGNSNDNEKVEGSNDELNDEIEVSDTIPEEVEENDSNTTQKENVEDNNQENSNEKDTKEEKQNTKTDSDKKSNTTSSSSTKTNEKETSKTQTETNKTEKPKEEVKETETPKKEDYKNTTEYKTFVKEHPYTESECREKGTDMAIADESIRNFSCLCEGYIDYSGCKLLIDYY